jgi:hypothetical protein
MYKTVLFSACFSEKSAVSYMARTSVHVPHTQLLNHLKTADGVSMSKTALFSAHVRKKRSFVHIKLFGQTHRAGVCGNGDLAL